MAKGQEYNGGLEETHGDIPVVQAQAVVPGGSHHDAEMALTTLPQQVIPVGAAQDNTATQKEAPVAPVSAFRRSNLNNNTDDDSCGCCAIVCGSVAATAAVVCFCCCILPIIIALIVFLRHADSLEIDGNEYWDR